MYNWHPNIAKGKKKKKEKERERGAAYWRGGNTNSRRYKPKWQKEQLRPEKARDAKRRI